MEDRKNLTEEEKEEIRRTDANSLQNFLERGRDSGELQRFLDRIEEDRQEYAKNPEERKKTLRCTIKQMKKMGMEVYFTEEGKLTPEGEKEFWVMIKEAEDKALGFV